MNRRCRLVILSSVVSLFLVLPVLIGEIAHATTLLLDTPTEGTLAQSGDADYIITLPSPGQISVTVAGWLSTFNWSMDFDRIYLYNAAGEPIVTSEVYVAHMFQGSAVVLNLGLAGDYTIRLHSGGKFYWPENVYSQSYIITAAFQPVDDIHEPNGTMETASLLTIGQPATACQWDPVPTLDVYGDEDWYRIELPSPGILTVDLNGWVSTYNWSADFDKLYVYRADGTYFNYVGAVDLYSWMMGNDPFTIAFADGGTYYLQFHAGSGISVNPYTISCTFQPVNDPQERNDSAETATNAMPGVTYTARQWRSMGQGPLVHGDEDWYRFTVGAREAVTFTITGWTSTYNWSADYDFARLYRVIPADTTEIFNDHMFSSAYARTETLDPGDYALRLHSGWGTSISPYTIRVDYTGVPSAVAMDGPTAFALNQPYPNPFNPVTTVAFTLPGSGEVDLSVYNIAGQRVRTLAAGVFDAGFHQVVWDGTNDNGTLLAAGVYFVRIEAGEHRAVRKVLMMK